MLKGCHVGIMLYSKIAWTLLWVWENDVLNEWNELLRSSQGSTKTYLQHEPRDHTMDWRKWIKSLWKCQTTKKKKVYKHRYISQISFFLFHAHRVFEKQVAVTAKKKLTDRTLVTKALLTSAQGTEVVSRSRDNVRTQLHHNTTCMSISNADIEEATR